jgi:hypothetical protein
MNQDINDLAETTIANELSNLMRGEQERVKANATLLGDPQLISGVKIGFKGLAKRRNGGYFVTGCIHTIDDGGYKVRLEMYQASHISKGVNSVSTTTTKEDVAKKAKELKDKKITQHPNKEAIAMRGYYLKTDFLKEGFELAAELIDRDWNIKMPGTIYKLTYHDEQGQHEEFIKIPVNPDGTAPTNPMKAFGYDALYDLFGVHDPVKIYMNFLDPKNVIRVTDTRQSF